MVQKIDKVTDHERGIWHAIEILATGYEENAVKILVESANFNREKCVQLSKETGFETKKVMDVIDWEMHWRVVN